MHQRHSCGLYLFNIQKVVMSDYYAVFWVFGLLWEIFGLMRSLLEQLWIKLDHWCYIRTLFGLSKTLLDTFWALRTTFGPLWESFVQWSTFVPFFGLPWILFSLWKHFLDQCWQFFDFAQTIFATPWWTDEKPTINTKFFSSKPNKNGRHWKILEKTEAKALQTKKCHIK